MIGVSVGFGKRLNWPDDYFTFQAELGYSWYYPQELGIPLLYAERYVKRTHHRPDPRPKLD